MTLRADDFDLAARPLLTKYCGQCHRGDDANGDVDLTSAMTAKEIEGSYELWESVAKHLRNQTMPPENEPQPTEQETNDFLSWYQQFIGNIKTRPAEMKPRRLSVVEYRNTLRSILGFDLEVDIIEAEQTISEKSLVMKLMPTDPPGKSGFTNDTHANPLTTVAWDQYSYLIDTGLEELFSPKRRSELIALSGRIVDGRFSEVNLRELFTTVVTRARRRDPATGLIDQILNRLPKMHGSGLDEDAWMNETLLASVKLELKAIMMSPAFLYRSLLVEGPRGEQQLVDGFEFAERLSYFLWADMPDDELMTLARHDSLLNDDVCEKQIDRMLASSKSRSLAEVFAAEWFTLSEIDFVSNNPPVMQALKSQPIDFMHYLFTENRPILEMIDSRTTFMNMHTAKMYGKDAKQLTKYDKKPGIEVAEAPNQRIELQQSPERGGILTMPGVLAMNRSPILRGTWMMERVLGEELPDPPANVGQVPANRKGEALTFRERFARHRADATCAVCHDKIDPLGFALQAYDNSGKYLRSENYKPDKEQKKGLGNEARGEIDTSGQLPSGETFTDIRELKTILKTTQREVVVKNVVRRTMAYALARRLELFDQPTVDSIVTQMIKTDGTWRDLFLAIAKSSAFRETILPR
ncbi:MAG: DUF1592 domain-containing protein [Pirellulaceae bacterium]